MTLIPHHQELQPELDVDYLTYLQFCCSQELQYQMKFDRRFDPHSSNSEITIIRHKCLWPGCQASFVFHKIKDFFYLKELSQIHFHVGQAPNFGKYPTSIFYRQYIKDYIITKGSSKGAAVSAHKALKIPEDTMLPYFAMKEKALDQLQLRLRDKMKNFPKTNKNQYKATEELVLKHKEQFPDDLTYFYYDIEEIPPQKIGEKTKVVPKDVTFIFASAKIIDLVYQPPSMYHLDATHKVLKDKIAYYILAIKYEQTHIIPLLHFYIFPDDANHISFCLEQFFQRFPLVPSRFMADCALNIFNAVTMSFPEIPIYWCALHVMRALRKNLNRIQDESVHEKVDEKMNILCYTHAMPIENAEDLYQSLYELILSDTNFLKYFDNQWGKHCEQWIAALRDPNLTLVNNVSESLFKKFKYYDLAGVLNWRADKLSHYVMTEYTDNAFMRIKQDLIIAQITPPLRQRTVPPLHLDDHYKKQALSELNKLGKFVEKSDVYLAPLIAAAKEIPKLLEDIAKLRKTALELFRSFELEEDQLVDIQRRIDKFCFQNPYAIVQNWDQFIQLIMDDYNLIA